MNEETVLLSIEGHVGIITLNREKKLNAMDNHMTSLLYERIREAGENNSIKAIVITGKGKAFSAGSDINEYGKMTKIVEYAEHQRLGRVLFDYIENTGKPIIAAVNGYCLGGGIELALACDLIVSSPEAKYGDPSLRLGVVPGGGTTQRLTRLIGRNKTKELLFTGEFLSAQEAKELGMVNLIVPADSLIEETRRMALKIISMPPLSLAKAKKLVNEGAESPLNVALSYEIESTIALYGTADAREGLSAFIEKREPHFKGE